MPSLGPCGKKGINTFMTAPVDRVSPSSSLEALGWNEDLARHFAAETTECRPARVAVAHNYLFQLLSTSGALIAEVSGRLRHQTATQDAMPVVGDWVSARIHADEDKATIETVLPRRTSFSRKAAGEATRRQLVAANIDVIFLVCGLDGDFNLRRIERYLVAIADSGARAVIVLNKADMSSEPDRARAEVEALTPASPIHVISCLEEGGVEPLTEHLSLGRTIALLGSSGVGKSTIINRMLGTERQRTGGVRRRDRRGRHTTTQRELIVLPTGGLLIDTPGMRELQLWDADVATDDAFDDIEALSAGCRFRDCRHDQEPHCAVRGAVEAGTLPAARLDNYRTLTREADELRRRREELARQDEQRRTRSAYRATRHKRLGAEP